MQRNGKYTSTSCCDSILMDFHLQAPAMTIQQLEFSIGEMERRFEAQFEKEMESINKRLVDITAKRSEIEVARHLGEHTTDATKEIVVNHVGVLERKLESIEKAVGITLCTSAGDDDEDRKRLKERLKEALEAEQKERQGRSTERETWLEYIFGICKQNRRAGKVGSR